MSAIPSKDDQIPESIKGLLAEGDYGQALREIERELLDDPQSISLWRAKIFALSASGRREEVLSCYDRMIQIAPEDASLYTQKADILESLERDDEALTSYEKAIAMEPANVLTLSSKAGMLRRLGRIEEALAVYDRIEQLSPGDPDYLTGKGDVLLSAGRVDEALLAFEQAAKAAPYSFGAIDWDTRGDTLYERENGEMALRFYDKATAADSQYAWAYRGKARVLNKLLDQPDRALEQLDAAIRIDPENAWFYLDKGNIFYEREYYEPAEECYRKATELDPKYEAAWSNLGLVQESLARYGDAALSAQKAIDLNPQSADAWVHKGFCLGSLEKFEEAEPCYRKALDLEPDNLSANGNMGWVLNRLGRYEEALPYHRKYLELNAADPVGWVNEADSLSKLSRWSEALERLHSGLKLASEPHNLLASIAFIYADSLFQHEKALEYYQQCLSIQPENADVACSLAECLVITGRYAEGRAQADKLINRVTPEIARGLLLVILASYALEGDLNGRATQLDTVLQHFTIWRHKGAADKEAAWNFNGLVNKVRTSTISAESKFLILTAIDIEQGQLKQDALSFFAAAGTQPESESEERTAAV